MLQTGGVVIVKRSTAQTRWKRDRKAQEKCRGARSRGMEEKIVKAEAKRAVQEQRRTTQKRSKASPTGAEGCKSGKERSVRRGKGAEDDGAIDKEQNTK